jgi:CubicO group peptidase (beta-lactamase class C family)
MPTNYISKHGKIRGLVDPGFEPVANEFERNFTDRGELGAAFSATRNGKAVVDVWGGNAAPDLSWRGDTLQVIFSGTKGLTAACMLMLIDRGQLDLEKPVVHYWPEFAANNKSGLLVRDIVSHHAGLPGIASKTLSFNDLTDSEKMESLLAAEPLSSDPNAYRCYHALTIGWLCGAVLRRIDGRSIGRFFRDEIAGPLSLDIWMGLPVDLEKRVGLLELSPEFGPWDDGLTQQQAEDPTRRSIWGNPPLFPAEGLPWNTRQFHASEIPGASAIATARSMARFYACLAQGGELDGVRLMRRETLIAGRRELNRFVDPFIAEPLAFGTVFALQTEKNRFGPSPSAFGHSGAGGSLHAAWPDKNVGFSYVMNQMRIDPEDQRMRTVLRALYEVVNAS